jgi:23S rRNA (adenine2030-N6)-methyltransferase
MLSYQHAYHAGNPADLHKHIVLAELLSLLLRKDRGFSYVETHAGRGLYDLASTEARKTAEADQGIGRIDLDPDTPYGRVLTTLRDDHGATAYPGSPMIAARLLRAQDRIILMEKHPQELAALKANMRGTIAEVHGRDGYEGVLGIAPLTPRKGLVLIDPAYEVKSEYEQVAEFVPALSAKWPEATIMVWYPLLVAGNHDRLIEGLRPHDPVIDEMAFAADTGLRMQGSGIAIVGAPFGTEDCLSAAHRQAAAVLTPRRPV